MDIKLTYKSHLPSLQPIPFIFLFLQLDPENVEALVALAIVDLNTNEGRLPKYMDYYPEYFLCWLFICLQLCLIQ